LRDHTSQMGELQNHAGVTKNPETVRCKFFGTGSTGLSWNKMVKWLVLSLVGWLHGTVVERRSLTGELSCTRPAADR